MISQIFFPQVLEKYHGSECNIDVITADITQKNRNIILNRI